MYVLMGYIATGMACGLKHKAFALLLALSNCNIFDCLFLCILSPTSPLVTVAKCYCLRSSILRVMGTSSYIASIVYFASEVRVY